MQVILIVSLNILHTMYMVPGLLLLIVINAVIYLIYFASSLKGPLSSQVSHRFTFSFYSFIYLYLKMNYFHKPLVTGSTFWVGKCPYNKISCSFTLPGKCIFAYVSALGFVTPSHWDGRAGLSGYGSVVDFYTLGFTNFLK